MRSARIVLLILACMAGTACATSSGMEFPPDAAARPAADLPPRFEFRVDGTSNPPVAAGQSAVGCRSPLTDPRSGAQLRFVRTQPGRGDYEVAVGQYGARAGELLRIDCNTLQGIGLVKR